MWQGSPSQTTLSPLQHMATVSCLAATSTAAAHTTMSLKGRQEGAAEEGLSISGSMFTCLNPGSVCSLLESKEDGGPQEEGRLPNGL